MKKLLFETFFMNTLKFFGIFFLVVFINNNCYAQAKKSNLKKNAPSKDSVALSKFLMQGNKNILTDETINKNKDSKPLTTLALYYNTQTILAAAKND